MPSLKFFVKYFDLYNIHDIISIGENYDIV